MYNTDFEGLLWRLNEIFLRAGNSSWHSVSTHYVLGLVTIVTILMSIGNRLSCVFPKFMCWVLDPSTSEYDLKVFGDRVLTGVIKVKWSHMDRLECNLTGALTRRENLDTERHWGGGVIHTEERPCEDTGEGSQLQIKERSLGRN